MYQPRASAGLDAIARLCGFPGKLGMDGSEVHRAVLAGKLDDVRRYCETDVLNTYLVYQRFRLLRGELSAGEYAKEVSLARERIALRRTALGAVHHRWYAKRGGRDSPLAQLDDGTARSFLRARLGGDAPPLSRTVA